MTTSGFTKSEILNVADVLAREKGIDREEVIAAMEMAFQKASRARYGLEKDISAYVDRKTGDINLFACLSVVEEVTNDQTEISLEDARRRDPTAEIGTVLKEALPPLDLGRVAAQTAKHVIYQRVRDAERQRQYEEFKNRIGEVINGSVKRVEFGNVYVELGAGEAILQRDQQIPRESFRTGDRVRAFVMDVRPEPKGPQVFLSRTHPGFMAKLFTQEVPEIYEGVIEIKAVARDPGSRAKMAVYSPDRGLDPVGSCVGLRGSRVQAVISELQGEKIDIIPWSSNTAVFVVNALIPAEVTKVVINEETNRVEVVVPDEQLSLAIGRRGQNVRLASILTGLSIDVMSASSESERRVQEVKVRSQMFAEALDVDDVLAHLLINEGFNTLEEVAFVALSELAAVDGLDDDIAAELQNRAKVYLEGEETRLRDRFAELGGKPELAAHDALTSKMLVVLAENDVKTLDELADLAADELMEMFSTLSQQQANDIIMVARARWFEADAQK